MKHSLKKLSLAALGICLPISTQASEKNTLYSTSFEAFTIGDLQKKTQNNITWKAHGKSTIINKFAKTGRQSLHLLGGENNTLELELKGAAQNVKALRFQAERWTSVGVFQCRVLAKTNGSWKEVANLDKSIQSGARFRSNILVEMPDQEKITGLKLVCTAPEKAGMLIDDFTLLKTAPVSYKRSVKNYVDSEYCNPKKPGLLPLPQHITWQNKAINLEKVNLSLPKNIKDALRKKQFAKELKQLLKTNNIKPDKNTAQIISFSLTNIETPNHWKGQEKEAYRLKVDEKGVNIQANTVSGLYFGLQTLRQLIVRQNGKTTIAACEIYDFPAFKIRGFMHDLGRNFQSIHQLKMQIDVMAKHKYNVFHFHCTEYHGWRLESKIYPNLQADSSFTRKAGKYYTQKEFVDLVNYCWERNITVIPEFDSPGHSDAFMKGVGVKTMRDPKALKAITELIHELCSLVPKEKMPYVHVGTDEVRQAKQRVNVDYLPALHKAVQDNGREVIGWSQGMTFKGAKQISQTWAKSNPFKGTKHIDSRSNYVNHLEALDFSSRMFFQQPCRQAHGDTIQMGGILCHWPDTKVDNEKLILTNNPIIPAMVAYSEAVWKGIEKNHNAYWAKLPNKGSAEYKAYADFENRLIQQRDRFHSKVPFPMVKTHNIEWRLLGPVAEGEVPELEKGTIKNSYTNNGQQYQWSKPVYGGAIHVKHFFGFPRHVKNLPRGKDIVWGNTHIYSPKAQEIDAWISFNTISSSDDRAGSAQLGHWNKNTKCNIWINGNRIQPPQWKNPGVLGKEIALIDNVYSSRKPARISLQKGWNSVLVKSAPTWKWVFSFSPVEKTGLSYKEVKGLKFSIDPTN